MVANGWQSLHNRSDVTDDTGGARQCVRMPGVIRDHGHVEKKLLQTRDSSHFAKAVLVATFIPVVRFLLTQSVRA